MAAAQDALALLFVFLEQLVMDGGKINRAFASSARNRAFAATADERLGDCGTLQYLKELDVIQTR